MTRGNYRFARRGKWYRTERFRRRYRFFGKWGWFGCNQSSDNREKALEAFEFITTRWAESA